jgi:hypothetical protein
MVQEVAGISTSRGYTPEEIVDMHGSGRLRKVAEAGYVGQGSIETGLVHFVPFSQSTFFRSDPVDLQEGKATTLTNPLIAVHEDTLEDRRKKLEEEHPMFRTTPQQKVARMMLRLMSEVKRTGTITGMSDADISAVVGEAWKQGEPLTAEAVQRVAAHLLGVGERTNKEADSKRVTRQHALA